MRAIPAASGGAGAERSGWTGNADRTPGSPEDDPERRDRGPAPANVPVGERADGGTAPTSDPAHDDGRGP